MKAAFGPSEVGRGPSVLDEIERALGRSSRVVLHEEGETPSQGHVDPVLPSSRREPGGRRYEPLREVRRSDQAVVFEGLDRDLGRRVALKMLRSENGDEPESLERFLEEAQLGGQLQHPGIPPVYGLELGPHDRPYFAMQLVEGDTLGLLLQQRPAASEDHRRFLEIFAQVCQTLAYAHARGVVHRNLEPSHVIVGRFGEVQVIEWGSARVRGALGVKAPHEDVDERDDVLALGRLLYEILTGERHGPDAHADLSTCGADEELTDLTARCLAAEREERPSDAAAVADAVNAHLVAADQRARDAELEAANQRALTEQARERERLQQRQTEWEQRARRRTMAIAAVVLVSVGVGGLVYLLKERSDRERARHTANEVASATQSAVRFEGERAWPEARAWARRAVAAARGGGAEVDIQRQADDVLSRIEASAAKEAEAAREAQRDQDMIEVLDGIRLSQSGIHSVSTEDAHRQYASAFRDYGIDVERLGAEEAASAIRGRSIAVELAAGLDDWSWYVQPRGIEAPFGIELWEKLIRVSREADPDEWRNRFREATHPLDPQALRRLAREAETADLPPATFALLGRYLNPHGLHRVALSALRAARARYPGDFWINYELGNSFAYLRRAREAARFFRTATALRPDYASLWFNVGWQLEQAGDRAGAERAYRRATELTPDHVIHHAKLGKFLAREARWEEAEAALRRGLEVDPRDATCLHHLGEVRWNRGDLEGAVSFARKAVREKSAGQLARARLALYLLARATPDSNDEVEALAVARETVAEAPQYVWGHLMLGYALYRAGQYAEALIELDRAIITHREFQPGRRHRLLLALVHARLGRLESGRSWYEKALVDRAGAAREPDLPKLYAEAAAMFGEDDK